MLGFEEQISDFIAANFMPAISNTSNFRKTTGELLEFLFETFPKDCITDYELNEILIDLNYERFTYVDQDENHKKFIANGWCLLSSLDLSDGVRPIDSE